MNATEALDARSVGILALEMFSGRPVWDHQVISRYQARFPGALHLLNLFPCYVANPEVPVTCPEMLCYLGSMLSPGHPAMVVRVLVFVASVVCHCAKQPSIVSLHQCRELSRSQRARAARALPATGVLHLIERRAPCTPCYTVCPGARGHPFEQSSHLRTPCR